METRQLGASDLHLPVVGLGTWQFGGRWGGADDTESEVACHAALDSGVNWIDTADIYGQGRAERIEPLRRRKPPLAGASRCRCQRITVPLAAGVVPRRWHRPSRAIDQWTTLRGA